MPTHISYDIHTHTYTYHMICSVLGVLLLLSGMPGQGSDGSSLVSPVANSFAALSAASLPGMYVYVGSNLVDFDGRT